jgi:hypothetical protein
MIRVLFLALLLISVGAESNTGFFTDGWAVELSAVGRNVENCLVQKTEYKFPRMDSFEPRVEVSYDLLGSKDFRAGDVLVGTESKSIRVGIKVWHRMGQPAKNVKLVAQTKEFEITEYPTALEVSHGTYRAPLYQYVINIQKVPAIGETLNLPVTVSFLDKDQTRSKGFLIRVMNKKSTIRVFDESRSCQVKFPAMTVSEEHYNPNLTQDMIVTHERAEVDWDMNTTQNISGFGYTYTQADQHGEKCPDGWHQHETRQSNQTGFSVQFVDTKTRFEMTVKTLKLRNEFILRPGQSGFIVEQQEEIWAPYRELKFDSCGLIKNFDYKGGEEDWTVSNDLRTYSLIRMTRQQADDPNYVNKLLLTDYPIFSTCEEKK